MAGFGSFALGSFLILVAFFCIIFINIYLGGALFLFSMFLIIKGMIKHR